MLQNVNRSGVTFRGRNFVHPSTVLEEYWRERSKREQNKIRKRMKIHMKKTSKQNWIQSDGTEMLD